MELISKEDVIKTIYDAAMWYRKEIEKLKTHTPLEQESCEDCISRQAMIDLVIANHTELNGINVVMYSPLCKDIKQLPPVTPKPKTDVLDKISEEIAQKIVRRPWLDFEDMERDRNDAFLEVLDIIDKYKVESEKVTEV